METQHNSTGVTCFCESKWKSQIATSNKYLEFVSLTSVSHILNILFQIGIQQQQKQEELAG